MKGVKTLIHESEGNKGKVYEEDVRLTNAERQMALDKLAAEKKAYEEANGVRLSDRKREYRLFGDISRIWG